MKRLVFTTAFRTHWSAPAVDQVALSAILGGGLGLLAWSPGHTPALGALFPLLWGTRPSRRTAFICAAAYHLAVVRFLPSFGSNWFSSMSVGVACWLAVGFVSGGAWALVWPRRSNALCVVLSVCAVLVVLLLPPFGALVPAHPVVAWGFLVPGSGWGGVGLMVLLTSVGAWWLRSDASDLRQRCGWLGLALLSTAVWNVGVVPQPRDGTSAGQVMAVQTQFGGFPAYGSRDVMDRLARMGEMSARQTQRGDPIKTVVFPEAVIGLYDRSLQPSIDLELAGPVTSLGRTLVMGADIASTSNRLQNAAIIFRPDGTSTTITARQTAPIAQWRPWTSGANFPADWLAKSTADVGGGVRARFMFCHEEWMPALHLLSEAREEQEVVIAMANLWAAQDATASYVQGSHTQGMALLFGRSYVRAVNGQSRNLDLDPRVGSNLAK